MSTPKPSLKAPRVVKRIKIIKRYGEVFVKPGRWVEWLVQITLLLILSPLVLLAVDPPSQQDLSVRVISACLFAFPQLLAFFCLWSRGWSLTLDRDHATCECRHTLLWRTQRTKRVNLFNGGIGPHRVTLKWYERPHERNIPAMNMAIHVTSVFLSPIMLLAIPLGLLSKKRILITNDYPGIIHYNETTDAFTILLVLEKPVLQKRILEAFVELTPEYISLM